MISTVYHHGNVNDTTNNDNDNNNHDNNDNNNNDNNNSSRPVTPGGAREAILWLRTNGVKTNNYQLYNDT